MMEKDNSQKATRSCLGPLGIRHGLSELQLVWVPIREVCEDLRLIQAA